MFSSTSRYAATPDGLYLDPSGRQIPYKLLRLTPDTQTLQTHTVAQGDRLDLIAFQYYGDPEQYWRVCDGNTALRPDDLTAVAGRRLNVPLAQR
ncbi:MAG TPA: hypothetical protein VGS20_08630 [Candidatus Acidoferrales bacterium]|nr:hypothetical protein [Candidatus Acidoferrales bacterium]